MSVYKNLVNVARTTVRQTKAFAPGIANTLEMVTLIKLSNAPEKGDNFWNGILKKFFSRRGYYAAGQCVCIQYTILDKNLFDFL